MLRPVPRPRTKTDEKTLRGRPVWIDETGYVTGEKGTRYSEQTVTIPFGTEYIVSPSIDEDGSLLSEEEVKQKLKDSEGRDFITGEKLPTFETEEEADKYAEWRSSTMENLEEIEKGYKPVLEQQQYEEDVEETLSDKVMRKAKPFTDEVKGFVEYLLTPSQHFNEGGLATQTETAFGFTAEGAKQEAEKYAEEFNEQDQANINKAAEFLVPFYDSGVNISNVVQEYMKPEAERDNEYIKDQFKQAGQSAAIEGGMLLMGGILAKYGAKGVKALADKVKQYEIDPNVAYSFPAIAIRKKVVDKSADIKEAEKLIDDPKKMKDWQESNKLPETKRQANPEDSKKAAQELFEGKITSKEARKRIQEAIPDPELYSAEQVLGMMPSVTEITGSLGKKAGKFGILGVKGFDLKKGQKVSSRLDIPAYNNYDTWVVSIHDGTVEKGSVVGFGQAIRLKNIRFGSKSKDALDIARGKRRTPAGEDKPMGKSTIARIFGEYVPEDPYKLQQQAADIIASGSDEWTQIGMNPYRGSGFYIKETGAPVFDADEVIQVGPLVLAKNIKKPTISQIKEMGVKTTDGKLRLFNEGGTVMKDDMNMGYALGGEVDAIDPVSGNEIPPGSTAKEVRDDIPTMLSEGEYVVPADVLKFYGLKFFEDLRENAKVEMAMMEEEGRIGGQPIPEEGDLTEDEMRLLGEVMGMAEGGMTPMQPQPPQPMMMGQQMMPPKPQPTSYNKPVGFNQGGMTDAFGNPIGAQPVQTQPPQQQQFLQDIDPTSTNIYGIDQQQQPDQVTSIGQEDIGVGDTQGASGVSGGGMKTVFYIHKDGRRISVLILNGKPISSVPADFNEFMEDTPENRAKIGMGETGEIETDVGESTQQKVSTEGSSGSEDPNESVEVYKASARKKPDASTPEGAYQLYEESGVNVQDPVGQAKKVLEGTTDVPKGAGILAGAINPVLGIGLGGFQAVDNLTAVSKAQANKQMAEFLGMESEAAAIQTEIDKFVKSAPGVVGALDEYVASGDQRFAKALESAFSVNAPDEMVIFEDKLSDKGKANVAEYLSQFKKTDPTQGTSLRPRARPANLGEAKPEITQRREVKGKYDVLSNKKLSGGYKTNTLSTAEQKAFDNAVDSGNWQTANHFAMVNRHRNKQDEFAKSGYDPVLGRSLGLSQSSMDQAKKYGGSVQTAINDGRAVKKGFFKPVELIKKPTVSTPAVKETRVTTRGDDKKKVTPPKVVTPPTRTTSSTAAANAAAAAARRRDDRDQSISRTFSAPKPKKTTRSTASANRAAAASRKSPSRSSSRRGGGGGRAKGGLMGKNK